MNDETPDIETSSESGDASLRPDAAQEAAPPKTKRGKAAAEREARAALEARIGHKFADPALLATAFTHVSALKPTRKKGDKRGDSYQRLEFLGDHVLGLVVSDMLYRAFPRADEGELSKRLADLVRKESCADVAKSLALVDDIKLGQLGAAASARLRKSVLGDICEAVIGAVFLDGGYGAAAQFVERNWTERMRKLRRPLRDPKTMLQEWAQGKGLPTPVYREIERTGPHHDPQFRVAVDLPGLAPAEGLGGNKRAAEKDAASVMIAREGVGGAMTDDPGTAAAPAATRCGFVALIGAPNVGKSTLVNALVGSKVTIVSRKVQTTRALIRGIVIDNNAQIILVDTPGIFLPKRRLDRAMVSTAWSGAHDADLVCVLLDAREGIDEEADAILTKVATVRHQRILVLNKIDLVPREKLLALAKAANDRLAFRTDLHGLGPVGRWRRRSAPHLGRDGAAGAVSLSRRPDVGRADAASGGRNHPGKDLPPVAPGTAVSIHR